MTNFSSHRTAIGLLGLVALGGAATWLLIQGWTTHPAMGVAIRLGILLVAIWLAWPSMQVVGRRLPLTILWGILLALAIVVIRPRILPVALVIIVAAFIIHYGLRAFAASQTRRGPPQPRR